LLVTPVVTFNGSHAVVAFAGLSATGLFQFNVTVPSGTADGDATVVASAGGVSSPNALITIKQ
jgi:uncharacterized protein (TIGR03437 family)